MKAVVIGVNHDVQWKDPTGDFQKLLANTLETSGAELIAEEAYSLPTTVGQRLACRMNKPWIDVDMDHAARVEAGIFEELKKRPKGPLFDPTGESFEYLPHADRIREEYWLGQILARQVRSVVTVCGLLHVKPFAQRLRNKGHEVEEVEAWRIGWYTSVYGTVEIFEQDGRRWCEIRHKD